jgi:hypothetical protein
MMKQEAGRKPFAISPESAADLIVRVAFPSLFALITRLGGLLPESVQRWAMPRFSVSERAVTD